MPRQLHTSKGGRGLVAGRYMDADLQQRAVEYKGLERRVDVALRSVQAMPPWLKRRSLLLRRMAEKDVRSYSYIYNCNCC